MSRQTLYFGLVSVIIGKIISQQLELFGYFFTTDATDWVMLLLLSLLSFMAGQQLIRTSKPRLFLQLMPASFLLIGFNLNFWLYEHIDWVSFMSYGFVIISSIVLGIYANHNSFKGTLWVMLYSILLTAGLFIPSVTIIFIVSLVFILLILHPNNRLNFSLLMTAVIALIFISYQLVPKPTIYGTQKKYFDKVVFSKETPFQTIDITSWKGNHWFYYNKINQFSTIDQWMYFEPLVHPVMQISESPHKILVIGGENGLLVKELLKYSSLESVDLVPIDSYLLDLSLQSDWFTDVNKHSLQHQKVTTQNQEVFRFLHSHPEKYDLIFIDVPDPVDIETNQYYTVEFYRLCNKALSPKGMMVTQAGSPYYSTDAFYLIDNTINSAEFNTVLLHNQILTLGEWGWILAGKNYHKDEMTLALQHVKFEDIETHWLNNEAMNMMLSFGKRLVNNDSLKINSVKNPIGHQYYTSGTWRLE